jgi:hypothetical protein
MVVGNRGRRRTAGSSGATNSWTGCDRTSSRLGPRRLAAGTVHELAPAFDFNHSGGVRKIDRCVDCTLAASVSVRQDGERLNNSLLKTVNRVWPRDAYQHTKTAQESVR